MSGAEAVLDFSDPRSPLIFVQTITGNNTHSEMQRGGIDLLNPHTQHDFTPRGYDSDNSGYEDSIKLAGRRYRWLVERHDDQVPEAASFAVACAINVVTDEVSKAGDLGTIGWLGRTPRLDLAEELGLGPDKVFVNNIVAAAADAQRLANNRDGWLEPGKPEIICRFGSGVNGAFLEPERTVATELGHEVLGGDDICTCGEHGHWEAYASVMGRWKNAMHGGTGRIEDFEQADWDAVRLSISMGLHRIVLGAGEAEDEHDRLRPARVHVFGSLVLRNNQSHMVSAIRQELGGLRGLRAEQLVAATYGNRSPAVGAYFLAKAGLGYDL